MPDPNLAGISKRSRKSTEPDRYWITTVDGARLREARIARGLSRRQLVDESGVSLGTLGRLEREGTPSCHRATLYRIAATLAADPESLISALITSECTFDTRQQSSGPDTDSSWQCSRTFLAKADQVAIAREFLDRILHGCPLIYETQLICSELVTNALRHSRSRLPGGRVIVRVEVREHDYTWLEVEDQGGNWLKDGQCDQGGRGLEIVAALSDFWYIDGTDAGRMICARLDWPEQSKNHLPTSS